MSSLQKPLPEILPSLLERRGVDLLAPDDQSQFIENVLPFMLAWQKAGEQTALITFVERDGSAPRPIGAQMAVSSSGRAVGHIASDCLFGAIVEEALDVIKTGENRLVRYGKGSPYIDLKLPCGSGIDLYFDASLCTDQLEKMTGLLKHRKAFTLTMDMAEGSSEIGPLMRPNKGEMMGTGEKTGAMMGQVKNGRSAENNMMMHRHYHPDVRLLIGGSGPSVLSLAQLAQESGISSVISTSDDATLTSAARWGFETCLPSALDITKVGNTNVDRTYVDRKAMNGSDHHYVDPYTAVVLLFHDHEKELPFYQSLLPLAPFYFGAMGSKRTHDLRLFSLRELGFSDEDLTKIKGPIGLIPVAKSPSLLALSVLSDILNEAQMREFLC